MATIQTSILCTSCVMRKLILGVSDQVRHNSGVTLSHNLIKEKLLDLIERTFYKKEGKLYLACNDEKAFFISADHYRVLSECM